MESSPRPPKRESSSDVLNPELERAMGVGLGEGVAVGVLVGVGRLSAWAAGTVERDEKRAVSMKR
jgi:hypothetical protein